MKELAPLRSDIAQIIEMWNNGMPASEIAVAMGITKNSVIGKVTRARDAGYDVMKKGKGGNNKRKDPSKRPRHTKVKKPPIEPEVSLKPSKLLPLRFVPKTVVPGHIEIQDLNPGQCKYPVSMSSEGIHLFCGERTTRTYCTRHHDKCYDRVRSKLRY